MITKATMIVWKLLCCSIVCNISFDWLIFWFYWYLIDISSNENTLRKLIGFPDYIIVALKKKVWKSRKYPKKKWYLSYYKYLYNFQKKYEIWFLKFLVLKRLSTNLPVDQHFRWFHDTCSLSEGHKKIMQSL